jgi:hypothetical protein
MARAEFVALEHAETGLAFLCRRVRLLVNCFFSVMIQRETSAPNPNPHPLRTLIHLMRQHWEVLALRAEPEGSARRQALAAAI